MALTIITWDHRSVCIWGRTRSGASLLHQADASDMGGFLALLESQAEPLKIERFRLYLDLPSLDHHVERVPKIALKMQKQLLRRRQEMLYGDEERAWAALPMRSDIGGAQQLFLVSSLANRIPCSIGEWSLKNGIILEGVFSLPCAIASLEEGAAAAGEASIHFRAHGEAGYLIARDVSNELLFFTRLDGGRPSPQQLQDGARRLGLFVEQEFGVEPVLRDPEEAESMPDEFVVGQLGRQKPNRSSNLLDAKGAARQRNTRLRHRAFALLCLLLLASIFVSLPLIEKKQQLELSLSELNAEIVSKTISINKVRNGILDNQKYYNVIRFSLGRETLETEAAVPTPLSVMMHAISNALPPTVELDAYSGRIEHGDSAASFRMVGRPLTADLDLSSAIRQIHDKLVKQGWRVGAPEVIFEQERGDSRFGDQRGRLRKFTLEFTILPSAS
ncbi:MAG: hypothetical protein NWT02_10810 [Opitutales bacterium]|nr:hypothetical protein [Opitutales bacterium]MDP4643701.1 hypothetical protein [Opitutales bacterium]MDP4777460.1 hypothetical protein [Opitutales bacterium]MDP4884176.1 hypothetical protein [Opitutales bacterium]MDP5079517.1 hypothetical protein [Opitutales bacterium]